MGTLRKWERSPQGLRLWGGTFMSFASTLFKLCLFLLCSLSLSVSYSLSLLQIHFRNGTKTTQPSTAHKRNFICKSSKSTFSFFIFLLIIFNIFKVLLFLTSNSATNYHFLRGKKLVTVCFFFCGLDPD